MVVPSLFLSFFLFLSLCLTAYKIHLFASHWKRELRSTQHKEKSPVGSKLYPDRSTENRTEHILSTVTLILAQHLSQVFSLRSLNASVEELRHW